MELNGRSNKTQHFSSFIVHGGFIYSNENYLTKLLRSVVVSFLKLVFFLMNQNVTILSQWVRENIMKIRGEKLQFSVVTFISKPCTGNHSRYLIRWFDNIEVLVQLDSIFIICNYQSTVVIVRRLQCGWEDAEARASVPFIEEPNNCSQNCQSYCAGNHQSWY